MILKHPTLFSRPLGFSKTSLELVYTAQRQTASDGAQTTSIQATMSRHIADRLPACRKIPAPKRKDPESPVSESNSFTEVPASEKHESASPELPSYRSHIFDAITQKVTERYEKPVLDEYCEEALGGGRKDAHPGNGGAIDRDVP